MIVRMDRMTLEQARERFGEIMHASTRTYREFDDPEGAGIWRPVYVDGEIASYRLHKVHKMKKTVWRRDRQR